MKINIRLLNKLLINNKKIVAVPNIISSSKILLIVLFLLLIIVIFNHTSIVLPVSIIILMTFVASSFVNSWVALCIFIIYSLSGILYILPSLYMINSSAVYLYILVFSFLLSAIAKKYKLFIAESQTIFIVLFFLLISVSAYYSGNIDFHSGYSIIKSCLFFSIIYFLIIHLINSYYSLKWLFRTILITGLIVTILSIYQYIYCKSNLPLYISEIRIRSFGITDPNYLAIFLIMQIPLAYNLSLLEKNAIWQFTAISAIFSFVIVIFLSLSRSAFILFIICLILLLKQNYINNRSIFNKLWSSIVGFTLISIPYVYSNLWSRISNVLYDRGSGRMYLYEAAYYIITRHPLTGIGYGNFTKRYYLTQDYGLISLHVGSHNMYLGIAAELGLIGLILYLAIYISAFRLLNKIYKSSIALHRKSDALMAQAIISSLIIYLLGGLFFHYYDFYLAYILLAIIVVLKKTIVPKPFVVMGNVKSAMAVSPRAI